MGSRYQAQASLVVSSLCTEEFPQLQFLHGFTSLLADAPSGEALACHSSGAATPGYLLQPFAGQWPQVTGHISPPYPSPPGFAIFARSNFTDRTIPSPSFTTII